MKCYKCDNHGESSCEYAKANVMTCSFECANPCVLLADKARAEAEYAKRDAEYAKRDAEIKLQKFRDAIRPFERNCREIVKVLDSLAEDNK